jgi:AraC-like DNA-binding protein
MAVIPALLNDPTQMQRLKTAIRDRHAIVPCASWPELFGACATQVVHLSVFDLFLSGSANFDAVRRLRQRHPRMTLVAYIAMTPERTHDVFDAGRVGVNEIILAGVDDAPRPLLALIERGEARSLAAAVRGAFAERSPLARDALLLAVSRAHERLSAETLAHLLSIPRRSLSKRLADEGLPAPQRLITWGRLIVAGHMLEEPRRSADRVAVALGFPSGSAFRNTCQRYLHATPQEIRRRGGSLHVLRSLLRQLEAATPPSEAAGRRVRRALQPVV